MGRLFLTFLLCSLTITGRAQKPITTYFSAQYNKTVSDYTIANNPWAPGVGVQMNFFNNAAIKPILELTADLYLMKNKVLRLNPDGSVPETSNDVQAMVNLFTGFAWEPVQEIHLSTTAGASLAGGQFLFGFKPAVGGYLLRRKVLMKLYYLNIFNRGRVVKQNFESIGFSMGIRVF